MRRAAAYCPAGISSFFQVCDTEADGSPILDPERIGSRGGGFAIKKGVVTRVEASESHKNEIIVFINDDYSPNAKTTLEVVKTILGMKDRRYHVKVEHYVDVPIGAGFGTSAAGALGAALALSKAIDLNLTLNQIGRIAHIAEVKCKTGLGTVSGLLYGGCVIVKEPGSPCSTSIDRIPVPPDYYLVVAVFKPRLTANYLKRLNKKILNAVGEETLQGILREPSLRNFLRLSRVFAEKTGLTTDRTIKLMNIAEEAGAIGAAQNMLGEAVHALVPKRNLDAVRRAFRNEVPAENIIVSRIENGGVRLIDE